MKQIIIIFYLLICIPLYAEIKNNYFGIDLIYNSAVTIDADVKNNGYGFDLFYQSFFSETFSYKIFAGFLYNPFTIKSKEQFYNSLISGYETLEYSKNEDFYNFLGGILFNYNILFKKIFKLQNGFLVNLSPYFSTGLIFSFIYKKLEYNYSETPIDFINTEEKARWLPASLGIPLCFGINYKLNNKSTINLNFTYLIINFDKTSEKYGYKNIMNFKFGYMHTTSFKL